MPYLTPEQAAVRYTVCRRLLIPVEYLHIVAGAISELLMPRNWEMRGDITVEQALTEMYAMWADYGEGAGCMIGTLVDYVTTDPPEGVLPCDGMAYSRVDYPVLYSRLDATYIVDADTFNVPDLRGRVRVSSGTGTGLTERTLADTLGEEAHSLTENENALHAHGYLLPSADLLVVAPGEVPGSSGIPAPAVTDTSGAGDAHNNMQPSYVIHTGIIAR